MNQTASSIQNLGLIHAARIPLMASARLLRRIAAADFSRGFQSTEISALIPASRQRRLNSGVADATRNALPPFPALKRRAKFSRRYAAKMQPIIPQRIFGSLFLTLIFALALPILALAQLPNYGDVSVKVESLHVSRVGEGYGEYRATITNHSTTQSHKITVLLNSYGYDQLGVREIRRGVELAPQSTANLMIFSPSTPSYSSYAEIIIDGTRQQERVTITEEKAGATASSEGAASLLVSQRIFKESLISAANVEQSLKNSSGEWLVAMQSYDFPVSEWSQNWMSFARFGGVILHAEEFSAAPETVRSALLRYVERGGTLIVAGNWQPPAEWQARRGVVKDEPLEDEETEPAPKPKSQPDLPVFYVGFGAVIVTGSVDPKEIAVNLWKQIHQFLYHQRLNTDEYSTLATINQSFQVVEKFGVPIRGLFLLMLLFVLVIGPINLIWLAKIKRKIWMLWTIPAISLLTCLFVAGFSLFGEGWSATARTEALTVLDETEHRATTIGWTGFYSPITPSEGLHFGYDTELIPQLPRYWDYRRRTSDRTVDWTNDQHLDSGWVSARVPAFFKLRKSEARRERLNIRQSADGKATLVNGLGAEIAQVWWADANGKIHSATNIAAGAQASLQATELKATGTPTRLREAYDGDWLKEFQKFSAEAQTVLMPNCYLAVLNGSPFVEEGLKNVKIRSGRNLVYGVGGEVSDQYRAR